MVVRPMVVRHAVPEVFFCIVRGSLRCVNYIVLLAMLIGKEVRNLTAKLKLNKLESFCKRTFSTELRYRRSKPCEG